MSTTLIKSVQSYTDHGKLQIQLVSQIQNRPVQGAKSDYKNVSFVRLSSPILHVLLLPYFQQNLKSTEKRSNGKI